MTLRVLFLALAVTVSACAPDVTPVADAAPAFAQDSANAYVSAAYASLTPKARDALSGCEVDRTEFDRLMALPQKDFDQDYSGGWRAVSSTEGCNSAAGDLILAYMHFSHPYPADSLMLLRWHAGQVKAFAGETALAEALFAGTYETDDTLWNHYVDATLAFLRQDRDALQATHDALAAIGVSEAEIASRQTFLDENPTINMPDGFLLEPQNLNIVRRLMTCFDAPYKEAYRGCNENG